MAFFFGSSRSWAAREARKKARHMAQKKRRTIIKTALSIFSFVLLSISLWSLTNMRRIGHSAGRTERTIRKDHGNLSHVAIKNTSKPELEMPRPPIEPIPPEYSSKTHNSSVADAQDRSAQGHSSSSSTSQAQAHVEHEGEGASIDSHHPSTIGESSYRSRRVVHMSKGNGAHQSEAEYRQHSRAGEVRGMNQEASSGGMSTGNREVIAQGDDATRTETLRDSVDEGEDGKAEKEVEVPDCIDPEEGGDGPIITLPKRHVSRNEEMGRVRKSARNVSGAIREDMTGGRSTGQLNLHEGETRGNTGHYGRSVTSRAGTTGRGNSEGIGERRNLDTTRNAFANESTPRGTMDSGNRPYGDEARRVIDTGGAGVQAGAADNQRVGERVETHDSKFARSVDSEVDSTRSGRSYSSGGSTAGGARAAGSMPGDVRDVRHDNRAGA